METQAHLANQDRMVNREREVYQVLLDNPDLQDLQVTEGKMDNQDHQETMDHLVPQDHLVIYVLVCPDVNKGSLIN